ncbi:carboxylesterase family protein [Vibrio sp. PP-XX7]
MDTLHLKGKPASVYGHKESTPGDIYADIQSDYTFRMPALQIAEHLVNNGNPVWHYNFSWRSAFGGKLGAAHFVDVPFYIQHHSYSSGTSGSGK